MKEIPREIEPRGPFKGQQEQFGELGKEESSWNLALPRLSSTI